MSALPLTNVLLRNIPPAPGPAPTVPAQVPQRLDDAALAAVLRAGRPVGEEGVLMVRGVGCPTVRAGHGAPLLLVHGLGHDSWDWQPLFVRCTKDATLYALDLPGFGFADKSEQAPRQRVDMALLVEAVLQAARACERPPVVVGSSLGGHIAILAALQEPRAFARLALIAPGGLMEVSAFMQAALRAWYGVDAIAQRREDELLATTRKIFAAPGHPLDDALAARKLSVRRSQRATEFAEPFSSVVDDVFRHGVRDRFPRLTLPTLVVSGARDAVVPPDVCAEAARRLGCAFELLQDVGHCPHLEAPDRTASLLMSFALAS